MVSKKEQIIQELSEKNIIDCQTLANGSLWGDITKDRERLEVKNAIFENIKRHSEGWIIKENVCVFSLYIGIGVWSERLGIEYLGKVLGFSWGCIRVYHTLLVYQPVPIKYDKEGEIIWEYRYQHELDTFDDEQKTKLQQLLTPTNADLSNSQQNEAIKPLRYFSFPPLYPIFGILIILALFFTFQWYRKVNKKLDKNKSFSHGKTH